MTLQEFNNLDTEQAKAELTKCCGAANWVNQMVQKRPFENEDVLFIEAEKIWKECTEKDWLEAFMHHPKIGDIESLAKKFSNTRAWAGNEQAGVQTASREVLERLAEGNTAYEEKFGYIFIVCATGKSAEEMLELLEARLDNDPADEIKIAMGEQHKITVIRLKKLLTWDK